jgi:hypothetical protein
VRYLLLGVALMCVGWSAAFLLHLIGIVLRGAGFDATFLLLRLLIIVCPAVLAYWLLTEQVGVL